MSKNYTLQHSYLKNKGHELIDILVYKYGVDKNQLYKELSRRTRTKGFHFRTANNIEDLEKAVKYLEHRLKVKEFGKLHNHPRQRTSITLKAKDYRDELKRVEALNKAKYETWREKLKKLLQRI